MEVSDKKFYSQKRLHELYVEYGKLLAEDSAHAAKIAIKIKKLTDKNPKLFDE